MTTNKKWLWGGILILLVASGFVWFQARYPKNQATEVPQEKKFDPQKNVKFGNVVSVTADRIEFRNGPQTYTAKITRETKLIKPVKEGNTIKLVDASITDFKVNQFITIFFTQDPEGNIYSVEKIQISNQ